MVILLSVLEVVFVLAVVVGVGLWSVPAALILAGVLGVVAVEREQARRKGAG
ncbi:hypothetical protein [Streptomyces sp. DH8]|uniref:hypothetical protein n=1 Tax=Streptomyces sp. DH8 TaxID=2857008 RepID=UPI001E4429EF|nr:hypothetical protein [Streptomyces sp. DH8]